MEKILLIILISSLVFGCKKDKGYTLTGVVYKDCLKEPSANREFILWQDISGGAGITKGGELAKFITDDNGKFSVRFEDDGGIGDIRIETVNSNNLFGGIPILYRAPLESTDLGNLYINNRATIDFYLDVVNTYTSSDTLIILGNYIGQSFIGPFTDGLLFTIENIPWTPYYDSIITEGEKLGIGWRVNSNLEGNWNQATFEPNGCDVKDEITIKIE